MKELSIEQKAQAYDKALEIIIDYYQKTKYSSLNSASTDREVLEKAFPQLKESEDERISKEIISAIKEDWPGHTEWIDWLEKKRYSEFELKNEYWRGYDDAKKQGKKGTNGNNGEIPFLAWSEDDEEMLKMVINSCGQCGNEYAYSWLKSLKDRVQPQKQWKPSDEQVSVLEFIMEGIEKDSIRYAVLNSVLEQLKKLKG